MDRMFSFTEASQFLSTLPSEKGTDRFRIRVDNYIHVSDLSYSVTIAFKKEQSGIGIVEMTMESTEANQRPSHNRFTLYPKMSSEEIRSLGIHGPFGEDFDEVKRFAMFFGAWIPRYKWVL